MGEGGGVIGPGQTLTALLVRATGTASALFETDNKTGDNKLFSASALQPPATTAARHNLRCVLDTLSVVR